MIKVKAKLNLYKNTARTIPIKSGYRPLFNFNSESKKSGQIELVNKHYIEVGSVGDVFIKFADRNDLDENFILGKSIIFDEGGEPFGEVLILEICH